MKKITSVLILILLVASLSCCTLNESERITTVTCPEAQIDTVLVPGWDAQLQQRTCGHE